MVDGLGVAAAVIAVLCGAAAAFFKVVRQRPAAGRSTPPPVVGAVEVREAIETTAHGNLDAIGAELTSDAPAGGIADAANRASRRRR